jgi:hypothetical protein
MPKLRLLMSRKLHKSHDHKEVPSSRSARMCLERRWRHSRGSARERADAKVEKKPPSTRRALSFPDPGTRHGRMHTPGLIIPNA